LQQDGIPNERAKEIEKDQSSRLVIVTWERSIVRSATITDNEKMVVQN